MKKVSKALMWSEMIDFKTNFNSNVELAVKVISLNSNSNTNVEIIEDSWLVLGLQAWFGW